MQNHELGILLIVLGVVCMVFGFFLAPVCGLGLVLLIIGIVLAATSPATPAYYYPQPAYGAPPQTYAGQPPAAGQPAAPGAYQQPSCYVCGTPLTWVAQYGRWYCGRCQAYR